LPDRFKNSGLLAPIFEWQGFHHGADEFEETSVGQSAAFEVQFLFHF
jgi:hypothetical protein